MNDFQLTNPENPDLCDPSKSQWYLDMVLANRIVFWTMRDMPEDFFGDRQLRVLEPSCGRGSLVRSLVDHGCHVVGVDIDPANVAFCADTFPEARSEHADFLSIPGGSSLLGTFNLVLMNPPFEGGQTEQHILHALTFAPRVVCHCPLTTLAGQDRRTGLWSQAYLKRLVIHASRPKYSGARTGGMTDMCTIDVVRRYETPIQQNNGVAASGVDVEWWA